MHQNNTTKKKLYFPSLTLVVFMLRESAGAGRCLCQGFVFKVTVQQLDFQIPEATSVDAVSPLRALVFGGWLDSDG